MILKSLITYTGSFMESYMSNYYSDPNCPTPTIRDKALQVCSLAQQDARLPSDKEHFTFVVSIIIVIEIITALISLYKACKTPVPTAADSLRSPDRFANWRLRRVIRQHCDGAQFDSIDGDQLAQYIKQVGATVTDVEVLKMYSEIN